MAAKCTAVQTNSSGTVTADQKYRAYGIQRDTGTVSTDHQFTGQKQDGTGLMYYGARFYDPSIGTFISADTIVPSPGNSLAYNRYMYVYGRVMNATDPSGHEPIGCYSSQNGQCYNQAGKPIYSNSLLPTPTPTPVLLPTATPASVFPVLFTGLPVSDPEFMLEFGATPFTYSNYNEWRKDPVKNEWYYGGTSGLHNGLDLVAPEGTSVYTELSGTVVKINSGDANPNVVVESNGYLVVYGHVNVASDIEVGSSISADTLVGTLSYHPNGSHLHITVRDPDSARVWNPALFFNSADLASLTVPGYGVADPQMESYQMGGANYWEDKESPTIGVVLSK